MHSEMQSHRLPLQQLSTHLMRAAIRGHQHALGDAITSAATPAAVDAPDEESNQTQSAAAISSSCRRTSCTSATVSRPSRITIDLQGTSDGAK